jgi:hypothetical protein
MRTGCWVTPWTGVGVWGVVLLGVERDATSRVIAQKQRWSSRAGGLIPSKSAAASSCTCNAELISEMLFHSDMARRICSDWWPGPSVARADDYLLERTAQDIVTKVNRPYSAQATGHVDVVSPVIALVGRPCSGKTAVMARVCVRLARMRVRTAGMSRVCVQCHVFVRQVRAAEPRR